MTDDFERWMADVNREVVRLCDFRAEDLSDYDFRGAFDAGAEPADVALDVIENDGTFA